MAPTLTPMRSPMPPRRRQFGLGGMRTVRRKKRQNAPRSSETEGQETATLVFSHSPFPNNNNNDSTDKSNSDGKTPMDERATNGRHGGGKLPLLRRPAMKQQKLFVHSQAEEEESISSSPGSRAGQSIADENSNDNSSNDNDYYNYYAKKMKADSNNDSDNETNNERGDNNAKYYDLEDSDDEEEEQQKELWDLTRVLSAKQIRQHIPIFCDTDKCTLAAWCVFVCDGVL